MKHQYRCFLSLMILFLLAGCAGDFGVKRDGSSHDWVPTEAKIVLKLLKEIEHELRRSARCIKTHISKL